MKSLQMVMMARSAQIMSETVEKISSSVGITTSQGDMTIESAGSTL